MASFIRILVDDKDWERARKRGEIAPVPTKKLDENVLRMAIEIMREREQRYTSPYEVCSSFRCMADVAD